MQRVEIAAFTTLLLLIGAGFGLEKFSPGHALLYLALLAAVTLLRLVEHRKFGRLGRPSVAIEGNTLVFARSHDTRGALRFALTDLQQLMVYGRMGRRTYRFVRCDGTSVETTPEWGQQVEQSVIKFLQQALPLITRVKEPQSLFASLRGDGP